MGKGLWIKRFIVVLVVASVVIAGAQMLKGHEVFYSVTQGAIWSFLSAIVYTAAQLYQSRRSQHCAICKYPLEIQGGSGRK